MEHQRPPVATDSSYSQLSGWREHILHCFSDLFVCNPKLYSISSDDRTNPA